MEKTNQLNKNQYGFWAKWSCEQAIMDLFGKTLHGLNNKKVTLALFIDLSKAFDALNHEILTKTLEKYGFHGTCKDRLISYLSNRKLCCKIDSQTNFVISDYYDLGVRMLWLWWCHFEGDTCKWKRVLSQKSAKIWLVQHKLTMQKITQTI